MELTIPKQTLLEGLQLIQGIIEKKSSMPILSNVLIESQPEEGITLTATDLQIGVRLKYPAQITQTGAVSLLARKFFEIVRELPDEDIYIKLKDNQRVFISCQDAQFNISGLPAVDYPPLPDLVLENLFTVDAALLKDMIQRTIISVSSEEGRYNLGGIFFEYREEKEKGFLRMVSTDGHRLTMMDREIEPLKAGVFPKGVLLPRKAVAELLRILEKNGSLQVGVQEKYTQFQNEEMVMIIRLLESNFPDYTLVLPKKKEREITVSKNHLLETMKRMGVLSTEKYKGVRLTLTKGNLEIKTVNPDIGEAKENIPLEYKGSKFTVGFNPRYFIDALQVMESEKVTLEFNEEISPAVLRGEQEPGFLALIMPMKLNEEELGVG